MQPLVKIYNFLIDSNCLILQLFLYHPCGLQIESQSANMTSDLTSDLIGALALTGVEINIRGHESFISAGAESQEEVLLSLVRLASNTFIYFYISYISYTSKFDLCGTYLTNATKQRSSFS